MAYIWHLLYNNGVASRKRVTFWLDERHTTALKAIKARDGVPESEQLRRALDLWIVEKGIERKKGGKKPK